MNGYVVFIGIKKVNDKINPNSFSWFMKKINAISMIQNGNIPKSALFKDILHQLGYTSKIDEQMRLISIN